MAELAVAALVVAAMYGIGLCNGSRSHIGSGVDGRALRSGELRRPGGRRRGVSVDWSFWVPMASCGLCCWGFFPSGAFAPQRNTAATAISRFTNNQVIQVKHLQVAFKMLLANSVGSSFHQEIMDIQKAYQMIQGLFSSDCNGSNRSCLFVDWG